MGSLIVTGLGHAGDELDQYWDQALKKSESVYGNRKVDLTLEAGLETEGVRIDGDQLTSSDGGFKGNIRFKVPIYSATQRMQREREKSDYLNRCAELIKTIRINQRVMKSLREKEKLLEATIQADGLEGVRNFYTAKSEYVEKEEEIGDAWRRLKALVQ